MYDMEGCSSTVTEPPNGNNKDLGEPSGNETINDECDSGNINNCASTNHIRKTNKCNTEENALHYTWKQTEFGIDILIKLKASPEFRKKFDATFTTRTAKISLSDEEDHVIHLYDSIIKEKSKVEIKRGNASLHIVKKRQGLWPSLEVSCIQNDKSQEIMIQTDTIERLEGRETVSRKEDLCKTEVIAPDLIGGGDNDKNITAEGEKDQESQPEIDNKQEKPVYHLDHLKHDFFERGTLLTLQVFCKCLGKDAVEISFHKQGFVVKFHTSDAKFLNLHAGTSSDTTFSWTVTTRGEIKPDLCSFKVKQSVVEVSLHKTSTDRWASFEAPLRKENETSKSNTWLPLNATSGNTVHVAPSSSSSSSSSSSTVPKPNPSLKSDDSTETNISSNKASVLFDEDLTDVSLREKRSKAIWYSDQGKTSGGSMTSVLSETIKFRSNTSLDKPTAKVQPLTKEIGDSGPIISPGYSGLVNLGNTCFMNCVLQVLANTREFRDYFLDGRFQHEINEENPLGMKGHLAATFGVLLHWLWSGKRHCWEPRKLKDLISKKNPQFFGFAQHDAHEFLAFLLDGLHEDLNRIRKKPYTETVDSNGRPDEIVASEAWTQYKQRNDSVVVDLFQGQYKSTLVCPKCGRVSITFDPFLYLSVPLPKKKKIVPVTFMWKEYYKKPHLFHIQVLQDSTVEHLIEILSQKTSVPKTEIRVFEAYKGKIHKFFWAGSSLAHVEAKDIIIACEVLPREIAGDEVLEIPVIQRTLSPTELPSRCAFCHKLCMDGITLRRCSKCYKVGYCDQTCQRNHWNVHKPQCNTSPEPIGCPFILSIPASRATYSYLVKLMEGFARYSVNIFQPPIKTTEGAATPCVSSTSVSTVSTSNLSSSLSQSCSSLNSLDSLSSASSTCTLTGDQSDPQIQDDGQEEAASTSVHDPEALNAVGASAMPLSESTCSGDVGDAASRTSTADSGIDVGSVKSERHIPTSQVMGVQAMEVERDKATTTFFIKPVTMDGVSVKGAEQLEDRGDTPLELSSHKFLSMDWRNNGRQQSCVLVQSKEMEAKEVDDSNNANSDSNKPTLYQCLELFTEPEILRPEEAWYCPTCKQHVEASKQMAIWKLPHTLIIQLKRFSFQNFLLRSKIKKHIDFPLRGLDLQQFCAGASSHDTSPLVYDLYGVANHHGLLIGGHYTSFTRCAASGVGGTDEVAWRLCDDSRVTQVANEKSVVTSDAYLLFYRLRGKPADINCSVRVPSKISNLSSRIIPKEIDVGDELESNSFDANNSGGIEEVEINEAVTLSSSSPVKIIDSSNSKTTTHNINEIEMSPSQGERSKISINTATVSQGVSLTKANVNSNGEDELSNEEDLKEKGDEEKEFHNCVKDFDYCYSDDDDDEDKERSLVIDTSPDLGYTDMEAVD